MQRIVPCLWFRRSAAEAVETYARAFGDVQTRRTERYPEEGLPDFQREFAGDVLTIEFSLAGLEIVALNAGDEFQMNPSISIMVEFPEDDVAAMDAAWEVLAEGGEVLMPLGEYPFLPRYGWVQDRWGMSWQLALGDESTAALDARPCLLFGGPQVNRAEEAIDFYTGLFPDSEVGMKERYPAAEGPAKEGSLMYAEFRAYGEDLIAMDSGAEQDFSFTEGVSLIVYADDQAEIDRLWEALSRVPEAEACGWCKDDFGVSWQVTPVDFEALMARPGAWDTLMRMKKLVIAEF